ncbi:ECF-type sigma factor [Bythopirellula polymerisocia]|uniref:RNA polymerase sigma factor SigD n=1 Tax=Bythopirellula polymerisocia TaxID=2528003 RepID=A0A5C6D3A2_9BACT|nr:ECF-type sigma factor [Bythopirellula polymerisocia]TWU30334.1 RNA polymerase sigma factor SigD [Bythopirellula polymerisocia]
MNDITNILSAAAKGDSGASQQLLPLVYDELRRLAKQKMAREKPGQTLDATALVHEAYLRLVGANSGPHWDNRGHFFAAAAESMRRILVENARRKSRHKHGGERDRVDLENCDIAMSARPHEVLAISEALDRLSEEDQLAGEIVKLRYFAGLSVEEAGNALDLSRANSYRHWSFARAWLQCELSDDKKPE